jgi:PAS domain S-box-containing protein
MTTEATSLELAGPSSDLPNGAAELAALEELQTLFGLSLEILCIAGADGYFKRVNPAFERTLGCDAEELLARPLLDFVHPDDRERTLTELNKLRNGLPTIDFENRYRCRDGSYRWLSWRAMPSAGGERIYAAADDVTRRKQVEEALRESEQRYRQLVESAPDALVVSDVQGRIILVNTQTERLFGYTAEELVGQTIEVLVPERFRNRHAAERRHYAASPRLRSMEDRPDLLGRRKDGSEFPAEISLSPIGAGEGMMICADIRDVSERKRAEELIRDNQAQLLAAQRIQARLLPNRSPSLPGFDIAGTSYPAEFTGGDAFDYLAMRDGSLGLAISDVSGHGFAPALLMASTHAYLRSLAHTSSDVGEILRIANTVLAKETEDDRFVTVLLGRLDPATRRFDYCSAGHPPGYVFNAAGEVTSCLRSTSIALGILPHAEFAAAGPVQLAPGDLLLLMTDGVLEALSPAGEAFGAERMLQVVRGYRHRPACGIVEGLCRAVLDFSGREKPIDDVTALVLKVNDDASRGA